MTVEAMRYADGVLSLIDQRLLPREVRWVPCRSAREVAVAIRDMVVRGAPAIGISAAYGMAIEALRGGDLAEAAQVLKAARPTAVNLAWAVDAMAALAPSEMVDAACALHEQDIAINRSMGEHGAKLLPRGARIYHHCNTGALATGGWGTALGIIRSAWERDPSIHVWVGETRPYLQGARLTAWELQQEGIPCTLVADSTAAALMADGKVDAVIVGCDRVAANGDTANKVGTLMLAALAHQWKIPMYIGMPTSTLDRACPTGADIPIEQRSADEVLGHGGLEWAAQVPVFNPAFDVTPAKWITAWVTEHGPWTTPFPKPSDSSSTA